MDDTSFSCVGFSKSYGGIRAVNNVSFSVQRGRVLGLVGPNGAGKSTLVDLIHGETRPDNGHAELFGQRLTGRAARRASKFGVARTFQHPRLALELSVRENLALGRLARNMASTTRLIGALVDGLVRGRAQLNAVNAEIEAVAEQLGIHDLDREAANLTLGEMRIAEVARAMLQQPNLVLLDEPFAGADAGSAHRLLEAVGSLARTGAIVLLIDHNVDLVAEACQDLVLLVEGMVKASGDVDTCLASAQMKDAYFGVVGDASSDDVFETVE